MINGTTANKNLENKIIEVKGLELQAHQDLVKSHYRDTMALTNLQAYRHSLQHLNYQKANLAPRCHTCESTELRLIKSDEGISSYKCVCGSENLKLSFAAEIYGFF